MTDVEWEIMEQCVVSMRGLGNASHPEGTTRQWDGENTAI